MAFAHPCSRRRLTTLLLLQPLALAVGGGLGLASQAGCARSDPRLPALRERPLHVGPLQNEPQVVTDEQLRSLLLKLRPRDLGSRTPINHIDHALRCWGVQAEFGDPSWLDGREMQRRLMDHGRFVELYGEDAAPLLQDHRDGVRVNIEPGETTSSSHAHHTMACLAEVGTPLDHPLITRGQTTTFRAMVEQGLRDFSLNQAEYEWSVLTFALYVLPHQEWWTRDRDRVDFAALARRAMRFPMPRGACFGGHRLYVLALLLRLQRQDEARDLLSAVVTEEVRGFLADMTRRLVEHQHADGYWDPGWPDTVAGGSPAHEGPNALMDRLLVTGHTLEWWGLLDPTLDQALLPPRSTVASAGQWLVRTVAALSGDRVQELYVPLTHIGRALALWRSIEPAMAIRQGPHAGVPAPRP